MCPFSITTLRTAAARTSFGALCLALVLPCARAGAQVRERPVAFDSAGRVTVITPPLASRLGLSAPVWPVSGDYIDARLYGLDDVSTSYVLVVRRQREILERFPLDASQRRDLAVAIDRGNALVTARGGPDALPTYISEPVRGTYVVNQTLLGGFLFGPTASALIDDPAAASAAYLAVTGTTFFLAANLTKTSSVSRAQNHLSWHSARRGSLAADALLYSATGDDGGGKGYAAAALVGGIAGDVLGFVLGEPMTDAEAHGTSHGSTVTAVLTAGAFGTAGGYNTTGGSRVATAAIVAAGALGYPLGLRYVRTAPYHVTAGDVGTLVTTEYLGLAAVATLLPEHANDKLAIGALTAGFALGALAGDQLLVRPFDHTESEARLVQYGAAAGALVALAGPVLAQSGNSHFVFGSMTVGGILGAILTENLIEPARAKSGLGSILPGRRNDVGRATGVDVRFSPESALLASIGLRGNHSLLSVSF